MSEANKKQVGGGHYKKMTIEHWDIALANEMPYMEAQIIKYVMRWRDKNGVQDLEKAVHYLQKLIEWESGVRPKYDLAPEVEPFAFPDLNTLNEWIRQRAAASSPEAIPTEEESRAVFKTMLDAGDTKRDGYVGYTYEGGTAKIDAYRCKTCRKHFSVPPGASPNDYHRHLSVDGGDIPTHVFEHPGIGAGVSKADADTSGKDYRGRDPVDADAEPTHAYVAQGVDPNNPPMP